MMFFTDYVVGQQEKNKQINNENLIRLYLRNVFADKYWEQKLILLAILIIAAVYRWFQIKKDV